MIQKRRATIKDVANQAGFSVATVSRILNGENSFLPETQKKVWDVAHSLGYEPSASARKLRAGAEEPERTRTNLIMHILALGSANPVGDKDIAASMHLFDWYALQQGYFTTNYQYYNLEGFRCPLLLDRLIDGAVVGTPHDDVVRSVSQKVPTVLLNVGDSHLFPELHRVNPAVEDGMRELLLMAYDLGHRNAAAIGAAEQYYQQNSFAIRFLRKYVNLAHEIGIQLTDSHRFQPSHLNSDNHNDLMQEITEILIPEIKSGDITLIICEDFVYSNSITMLLKEKGIRIPEDVSVIGVDSSPSTGESNITSAKLNWEQMFQTAIKILDDLINHTSLPCREFRIATKLNQGVTLGPACTVRK
ncbi:MAG: LacI family DNA-binding transcriptional regulator [Lentisphaeria bacterium]|nr:LacI family DNA-binding transcriptional regulator [Lentisphaeria bacterium]